MKSTVKVSELEERIFQLIGKKKYITNEDLEERVSVYEMFHILVLREDCSKIEFYDLELDEKSKFSDDKYCIEMPKFKMKKRGDTS